MEKNKIFSLILVSLFVIVIVFSIVATLNANYSVQLSSQNSGKIITPTTTSNTRVVYNPDGSKNVYVSISETLSPITSVSATKTNGQMYHTFIISSEIQGISSFITEEYAKNSKEDTIMLIAAILAFLTIPMVLVRIIHRKVLSSQTTLSISKL